MNDEPKNKLIDQSLGEAVREYVRRKFGEYEARQIILTHESLRYIIANFTVEWLNIQEAKKTTEAK